MAIVILPSGDGKIHQSQSLQENNQIPNLTAAQNLAASSDTLTGNTTTSGTGKFGTVAQAFAPAMVTAKNRILLMPYVKGPVWTGSSTPFPESWWCHWGNPISSTNRVCSPQGTNIFIMQPDSTANFTDTGGLAGTAGAVYAGWKNFHAAYVAYQITQYNTHFAGNPLQGAWMDYAPLGGTKQDGTTNVTQVVPGGTTAYTAATWYPIVNTFIDAVRGGLPAGMFLFANGIVNNTHLDDQHHADGVMYENWLRSATGGVLPGGCPADSAGASSTFLTYINTAITVQSNSVYFQGYTKLWSSMTAAQQESWRAFMCACYLLADNGSCGLGFAMHVPSDGAVAGFAAGADLDPWDSPYTTGPNFSVNLGSALSTQANATSYRVKQGTSATSPGWMYERRFQNGVVRINTDGNSITQALDRTYKNLDGSAASTTVPGRSAVILTTTAVPTITSGTLDVTGSGAITIPTNAVRVRMSGSVAVSGSGVVTVIDTLTGNPTPKTSGTLSVSGSGSVAISASLKVNVSGGIAVGGSSSITAIDSMRVRKSGTLYLSGSGSVDVSTINQIWTSGSIVVAGTGAVTVVSPMLLQRTGVVAVSGTGAVTVSDTFTTGGIGVASSGTLVVSGSGAAAISDSLHRAVSGVLSLSGTGLVSVLGVTGPVVSSGFLDVSGAAGIEAVPADTQMRHHDSLNPEAEFIRRFFH